MIIQTCFLSTTRKCAFKLVDGWETSESVEDEDHAAEESEAEDDEDEDVSPTQVAEVKAVESGPFFSKKKP